MFVKSNYFQRTPYNVLYYLSTKQLADEILRYSRRYPMKLEEGRCRLRLRRGVDKG